MAKCSSCGKMFAEIVTPGEMLVVIDRSLPGAAALAERLTAKWQGDGKVKKRCIVDRRRVREEHEPPERRRYQS